MNTAAATKAMAIKLNGKKPWRVTDQLGRPLKTAHGKPIDRGGYERASEAAKHAESVNRAAAMNQVDGAMTRITKRQKQRHRRQVMPALDGAPQGFSMRIKQASTVGLAAQDRGKTALPDGS